MYKKLTAYLLCAALIFPLCLFAVFAAGPAVIEVGRAKAAPGDKIVIPVTIDSNPGIAGFKIKIGYDQTRLKTENQSSVAKGTALGGLSYIGVSEATVKDNPFTVLWYGPWNDSSNGIILNLTFTVLENAPAGEAYVEAVCEQNDAVSSSGAKISVTVKNGGITIIRSGSEAEPAENPPEQKKPAVSYDPDPPQAGNDNKDKEEANKEEANKEEANKEEGNKEEAKEGQGGQKTESFGEHINKLYKTAGNKIKFSDVSEKDWFFEAVFFVSSRSLFLGTGNNIFMPKGTMTRGMFLTVLARLDGEDLNKYKISPYSDTDIDQWYGPSVAWAAGAKIIDAGILSNRKTGEFGPGDPITREEMAVIFANFIKYKNLQIKTGETEKTEKTEKTQEFADIEKAGAWAREAVREMRRFGIIGGIGNNLYNPKGEATRAEVAQIFKNLIFAAADPEIK